MSVPSHAFLLGCPSNVIFLYGCADGDDDDDNDDDDDENNDNGDVNEIYIFFLSIGAIIQPP